LGTRNQSLDVLRALAVLLVMGRHFPYYALWGRVGWVGVDLFFVLSGFLISGLLFQEYKRTGMIDFWRFTFRRGLKIWPPLYVFLMATATAVLLSHQAFPRGLFAAAAGFYMNYFLSAGVHNAVPTTSYLVTHTWSLAVEEHFYAPKNRWFVRGRRARISLSLQAVVFSETHQQLCAADLDLDDAAASFISVGIARHANCRNFLPLYWL
jgi:peptidoglycan/LPS O-acetylase OafA/YrhL